MLIYFFASIAGLGWLWHKLSKGKVDYISEKCFSKKTLTILLVLKGIGFVFYFLYHFTEYDFTVNRILTVFRILLINSQFLIHIRMAATRYLPVDRKDDLVTVDGATTEIPMP